MKYFIISGEPSGDLHGSKLIKGIFKSDSKAEIAFWGGDLMEKAGGKLLTHYNELALSLIHISEPTRRRGISYAVFCLKKKI